MAVVSRGVPDFADVERRPPTSRGAGPDFGAGSGADMGSVATQPAPRKLGEILLARGVVDRAQLDDALVAQGSSLLPIGSTLIRLGYASEHDVALALAEQFGMPAVLLGQSTLELDVLGVIPKEVASAHRIMPLAFSGQGGLNLGLTKPAQPALLDEIAFASGRSTLPFVVPRVLLEDAIREAYDARRRGETIWRGSDAAPAEPFLETVQPPPPSTTAPIEPDVSASALDAFPAAPAPAPRAAGSKPLVLAVDDEPEILEILELTLANRGMEVRTADGGRKASDILRAEVPDVILLDAMLPEIHGFELCSQIKKSEQLRHVPVIIISAIYTGWNFSQDVRRMYGADDYIEKPFSPKEVAHRVEQMLARSGHQAQAPEVQQAQRASVRAVKKGLELLQSGEVEPALEQAERAVELDPFEPRAHFVLASALNAAGRFYEAISAYERVVELAPEQFSAQKNLAVLYERQGFRAKAVEMWMRALENSPSDAVRQTVKAHLVDLL